MNNLTDTSSTITISEKALKQVKQIMSENNIPHNYALRISIKGGGCSGFTYNLGFDGDEKDGDTFFENQDLRIVVDGKSLFYLMGTQLDFSDGLNGRGFIFNNPNAAKTCGCGESFGV
ncbi:MAG: iron-sulfur cluster insertion protein ErpA [Ignavibacteriales bacterium]|jgi:iron-sulfur cluster assembly protein|nr:iron-sulfur cluster insertion protein ErpA [Ignavibacteriales bacterium]MBK7979912.1 iron-sulfur cluster insertion protein ErpA [Ignavibacteriota bacterium]